MSFQQNESYFKNVRLIIYYFQFYKVLFNIFVLGLKKMLANGLKTNLMPY